METGDVIQITDDTDHWYPCLLIVEELKSWGVVAYLLIPGNRDEAPGIAYRRLKNGSFARVGSAVIVG